jgi:hypothetical protein
MLQAATRPAHIRRGLGILAISSVGALFLTGHVSPNAIQVGMTSTPVTLTINKTVSGDGGRPTAGWEFTVASPNCPVLGTTVIIPSAGGSGNTSVSNYHPTNGSLCIYTVTETSVAGWTSVVAPNGPFSVAGPGAITTISVSNTSPTTTTEPPTTTTTTTTTTETPATTTEAPTTTVAFVIPVIQVTPPAPAAPEAPTSTATSTAPAPPTTTTTALASTTTSVPAVLGSIPSGAVATPGLVEDENLALTGDSTDRSLLIGAGLVGLGSLAVIATRKRASQK